ncbi:MAG TPA: hypothetical protein VEP68_02475 [Anaeromyxobacteraceae bacterium]|nr:hypothetical protein [Anaeromyxobacteraceae bacterium]
MAQPVSVEARIQQEEAVVQQYALRWAVLAAWRDALAERKADPGSAVDLGLTRVRVKIASGCFSACEIGCDLSPIEAALTSADASSGASSLDFWLDLLGHAMRAEADRLLKVPAVKFRFADCGVPGCRCAAGSS